MLKSTEEAASVSSESSTAATSDANKQTTGPKLKRMVTKKVAAKPPQAQSA